MVLLFPQKKVMKAKLGCNVARFVECLHRIVVVTRLSKINWEGSFKPHQSDEGPGTDNGRSVKSDVIFLYQHFSLETFVEGL